MESKRTMSLMTQVGDLTIEVEGGKLLSLSVSDKAFTHQQAEFMSDSLTNPQMELIRKEVSQYFSSAKVFKEIQLAPQGTLFQRTVWNELKKIPLGETRTYGEIAKKLNSSARAVGNACRKNPIQIIIPCHRVVSAKGIGGYAGKTEGGQLAIKRWLLNHEGIEL